MRKSGTLALFGGIGALFTGTALLPNLLSSSVPKTITERFEDTTVTPRVTYTVTIKPKQGHYRITLEDDETGEISDYAIDNFGQGRLVGIIDSINSMKPNNSSEERVLAGYATALRKNMSD